ncbi:MAG: helix-turn-helix transcriptional regulator [Cyanobacteria bacterium SBLK]|nr:helix-turn-helix transcriptional regulator [Cyanobacteria bacterium SBLK]
MSHSKKHVKIIRSLWLKHKKSLPTQKEMAERLNIDESRLSRFMQGRGHLRDGELFGFLQELPHPQRWECWCALGRMLEIEVSSGVGIEDGMGAIAELKQLLDSLESSLQVHFENFPPSQWIDIRAIFAGLWPRWEQPEFRGDFATESCYATIELADIAVDLILQRQELAKDVYRVIPSLRSVGRNYLPEKISLSVEGGGARDTAIAESETHLLKGMKFRMKAGAFFDIIVKYKNNTHTKRFGCKA